MPFFTLMNLKSQIIDHQSSLNNTIFYVLQVEDQNSDISRTSKLRYSQFREIHQEIDKIVSKHKLHIILPQFPGRKPFSSTNKSPEKIAQRKQKLTQVNLSPNQYLLRLLSIQKLHSLQIMKKYYVPDKNPNGYKTEAQISIDRYTLVGEVIIYYVKIKDLQTSEQWTFKTRYSELRNVHDALVESRIKNLPEFPKKKLFGMTNDNPEDIQRRREELQKYFNEIFSNHDVMRSQALRYFVEESKKQAAKDKQLQLLKRKANSF